jgi:phosphatidylglycerol lysyltransferase
VPAESLLSAILVWRLTYTFIPFLLAVALFVAHELRHPTSRIAQAAHRARRIVLPLIPAILAGLTFLGGLVLLTSGALPNDYSRIRALRHLVPLPFAEVSHLVGSTAGVVLLILSRGLMRRLSSAWTLAVVVIGAGMVVSLAKGFDWEEALILGAVLSLLLTHRSAFYRKAGIFAEPLEPRWIVAITFIVACTTWLGFAAFHDVDYSHELWWQFNWQDDASRFLRSSLVAMIAGAGLSLYAMIHRSPGSRKAEPLNLAALDPALSLAERADAQLALLEDKRFLFHDAGDAFLMYAVRGKSWIAMGDPVGRPERAASLMWQFLEEVDRHAGWPVFYQVSPEHLLFRSTSTAACPSSSSVRKRMWTSTPSRRKARPERIGALPSTAPSARIWSSPSSRPPRCGRICPNSRPCPMPGCPSAMRARKVSPSDSGRKAICRASISR